MRWLGPASVLAWTALLTDGARETSPLDPFAAFICPTARSPALSAAGQTESGSVSVSVSVSSATSTPHPDPFHPIRPLDPAAVANDSDPDSPFLSFEEWKALQAAVAAASFSSSSSSSRLSSSSAAPAPSAPSLPVDVSNAISPDASKRPPSEPQAVKPSSGVASPSASKSASSAGASRRFNYASTDCSARVHYSSRQTKSPSSILRKSRDRYMLTPCSSASHYVVIELCDEIRIDTLEVGNFEFFSSIVKGVRVRAGDTEGEGEHDEDGWKDVGSFEMSNVRGMQSFKWETPTSFHRFLRLDFVGHYGNEYYCPVSLVRIYGLNQMEAYRYELGREKERERLDRERDEGHAETSPPSLETVNPEPVQVHLLHLADDISPPTSTKPASSSASDLASLSSSTQPDASPLPTGSPSASSAVPSDAPRLSALSTSASAAPPSSLPSNVSLSSDALSAFLSSAATEIRTSASLPPPASSAPASASASASSSSTGASSSSASSSSLAVARHPPAPIQLAAPSSDSHESIYAFIIRRLNSLESNSSLATHYIEQQSRLMRGAFEKMERELKDWRAELAREEGERWSDNVERLKTQQARSLKTTLRAYDAQLDRLLSTSFALSAQLHALDAEVVLQRRLLALAAVLLGTVLVCFFVIRLGGIEVVKGDERREKRRERERLLVKATEPSERRRERPVSPRFGMPHEPRPASPRLYHRTRPQHVGQTSTPKRSSTSHTPSPLPPSPPSPHLPLPFAPLPRPRSSLSQHATPSHPHAHSSLPQSAHHRRTAAARTTHLHSLPFPGSSSSASSSATAPSPAVASVRKRVSTAGPHSPRRFGSPSFLVNLATATAAGSAPPAPSTLDLSTSIGLGISSPVAVPSKPPERLAATLVGGEDTDEGWSAATSDEEGGGMSMEEGDGPKDESRQPFVLGRAPQGRASDPSPDP